MLYALGDLTFEVAPFNVDGFERSASTDYAWKPVMQGPESAEWVGEGAETLRFHGRLFPDDLGGLSELTLLHRMRICGQPHALMRGDGVPLGWFLIERVNERASHLGGKGVPKVIEIDIELRRSQQPKPSDYVAAFFSFVDGLPTPAEIRQEVWGRGNE